MTLTVPKGDPEAFPLLFPAGSIPRFHEQCFIGEPCNKEIDNITGIECECPGYEIERLLLKCNNQNVAIPEHAQFENKTNLVPGFSTSSRNYDAFVTTSSAEVISSPTVNTKIAAVERGNKAAVERGHTVMVYLAFLILIQKVIIRH